MPITSDTRLTELPARTKPPAVAGLFYPDDPDKLQQSIRQMLADATRPCIDPPKALIAPHAGYIYSGPVAASAYATLLPVRHRIKRVILLGPAHRVYLRGLALPHDDYFSTPLGNIRLDDELRGRVARYDQVCFNDAAFTHEHSLEVHLPFLQSVLPGFTLLPLLVGDASADQVAEILQQVWGGDETLIVISSDLSHYHDYATARRLDQQTSDHIRTLQYTKVESADACGCRPVHGLLQLAQKHDYEIEVLDVRNSGDTAGDRDRVVGYGAYALYPATALRGHHRSRLIGIAGASIDHGLEYGKAKQPDIQLLPRAFQKPAAVFVTLRLDNRLRGCIGHTEAVSPLAAAVAMNAWSAAFRDPRFPALTRGERERVEISISILSEKSIVQFDSEASLLQQLQPGISGLIIASDTRSATFLPSVWDDLPQPAQFLAQLKQKAGIGRHEPVQQAWVYGSVSLSARPGER